MKLVGSRDLNLSEKASSSIFSVNDFVSCPAWQHVASISSGIPERQIPRTKQACDEADLHRQLLKIITHNHTDVQVNRNLYKMPKSTCYASSPKYENEKRCDSLINKELP